MKRNNPKVYHGSHEPIHAWVASTDREFRSWETFGTFFTTNKNHARIFGKQVHELDLDEGKLHLFQASDLWTPLFYPALHGIIPVKLKVAERKIARLVFIGNEKTGEGPLIEKWHEIKTLWRNVQKPEKWDDTPPEHRKRLRVRSDAIDDALDVMRKLGSDRKYVEAMTKYFVEEGFDGFYWPNADHDVASSAKGEPKYRHDVFFLFHPEKLPTGALVNPKRYYGEPGSALASAKAIRDKYIAKIINREFGLYTVMLKNGKQFNVFKRKNDGLWQAQATDDHWKAVISPTASKFREFAIDSALNDLVQYGGELDNPHLGNTGREFKRHAALRVFQDRIEKETGKQLSLSQVETIFNKMVLAQKWKQFRVVEGLHARANPMSLRSVDALISLCKRKWGGQAAGWAADFAAICRRGTPQKKLWERVAQGLKREMYANPRPKRQT